jgi:phosphinothricin acetyltransferase
MLRELTISYRTAVSKVETTIRRAEPGDARAIAEIYNEAIQNTTATFDTEPKTEQDRLAWLQSHDDRHPVLVAERDGQIVGWASLSKWSDRPAYAGTAESSFYVAVQFRGLGIGRALKERLIEEARKLGLHTILARVAEGNAASLHLNKALGFVPVGIMREVGLKFGRRLDVHLLQLMLDAPTTRDTPAKA